MFRCSVAIVVPIEVFLKHMLFHHASKRRIVARNGQANSDESYEQMLFLICTFRFGEGKREKEKSASEGT